MTTADILCSSAQDMEVLKKEGEHPSNHLCKICSKRFVSGRALGGHMRAHAPASIATDTLTEAEFQKSKGSGGWDHKSMEEEEKNGEGLDGNGGNLTYALRRNPKRSGRFADRDYSFLLDHGYDFKPSDSSINCDVCGKEFSSWNGLFGHMKCHSETHQDTGDAQSQKHETQDVEEERTESEVDIEIDHSNRNSSRFDKWMRQKRSKKPRYAIQLSPHHYFDSETDNEEEEMAMCLLMLASGVDTTQNPQFQEEAEEAGSGDLNLSKTGSQLLKCIRKKPKSKKTDGDADRYDLEGVKKARYKCTICNRFFHSYQALGGHRASHNKVQGSVLQIGEENESLEEEITDEELIPGTESQLPGKFHKPSPEERTKDSCVKARDETTVVEPTVFSGKKTPRNHECSICHRVFGSGQALGGHKKSHWSGAGASDSISTTSSNKEATMEQAMPTRVKVFDLNLPAPIDNDCDAVSLSNLGNNAVDSHGASDVQTHSPPYSQSWLMGMSYTKQGLFLSKDHSYISKTDEVGCDSDFGVKAVSWL